MAKSPAHRFGQVIGDLLEEIIEPVLQEFCKGRGLYLDKKGPRGPARKGKKVSWVDQYGNSHDLDFVIEKDGTIDKRGRPLAFIESAWRRYTKHSRAKAQEIQAAVRPVADTLEWDRPFLGALLAGIFTKGALDQLRSNGFEVAMFPYETVVECFDRHGINIAFDENTDDAEFQRAVDEITALRGKKRKELSEEILKSNHEHIRKFLNSLTDVVDRQLHQILVIPLHGKESAFDTVDEAIHCIENYDESRLEQGTFRRYEIIVRYLRPSAAHSSSEERDSITATFHEKKRAIAFLKYVEDGLL